MSKLLQIITVAKKEYKDTLSSNIFLIFLVFLLFLIGVSILVASFDFQAKVQTYESALAVLKQSGQNTAVLFKPEFYPLQLLRGSIEYLEIIGAILAIVIGYLSVVREKGSNTLQLIFTRPISKLSFFLGKLLGNAALLSSVCAVVFAGIYLSITFIGGAPLTLSELVKLLLSFSFSVFYLNIFFCFSFLLALTIRSLPNALIAGFVLWLIFVLIIPQIGDTMDPDNQVPGGFFNSIHITDHGQQLEIMKQFSVYETTRNALEESSITKHYERLTFALLGIKTMYNNQPLSFIFNDKAYDGVWIIVFLACFSTASGMVFTKRKILWEEDA